MRIFSGGERLALDFAHDDARAFHRDHLDSGTSVYETTFRHDINALAIDAGRAGRS